MKLQLVNDNSLCAGRSATGRAFSFLLLSPLRCVQVKPSLYRGYCISRTMLPLRQHKQPSQELNVRCEGILPKVSFGEIQILVVAVLTLFSYAASLAL